MRTNMLLGLLCLFLLNVYACNRFENKETDHLESQHPVKELFLSSIEAFNEGNLELFLANFDTDIKMYGTDGVYSGRSALQQRFSKVFEQFPQKRMEIPEIKLEILSDKVVLVHFQWKLYPMGKGPAYSGIGSGIYVLNHDNWLEILEIETVTHVDEELMQ